jgi:hypothetical protein
MKPSWLPFRLTFGSCTARDSTLRAIQACRIQHAAGSGGLLAGPRGRRAAIVPPGAAQPTAPSSRPRLPRERPSTLSGTRARGHRVGAHRDAKYDDITKACVAAIGLPRRRTATVTGRAGRHLNAGDRGPRPLDGRQTSQATLDVSVCTRSSAYSTVGFHTTSPGLPVGKLATSRTVVRERARVAASTEPSTAGRRPCPAFSLGPRVQQSKPPPGSRPRRCSPRDSLRAERRLRPRLHRAIARLGVDGSRLAA